MAKLTLVPTPVGNLEDITLRALRMLKEADLILAEDTRTTSKLLKHYDIATPMQSHHKINEHKTEEHVVSRILAGEHIALVSDAGTPGISDPGFLLVRLCLQDGIMVECLPGATAFVPALVVSGLPGEHFHFEGFLPQKKGRLTRLRYLADLSQSFVLYESPYRVLKTLTQLAEVCGPELRAAVSREISKLYEESLQGSLEELIRHFSESPARGEFVLVVAGKN